MVGKVLVRSVARRLRIEAVKVKPKIAVRPLQTHTTTPVTITITITNTNTNTTVVTTVNTAIITAALTTTTAAVAVAAVDVASTRDFHVLLAAVPRSTVVEEEVVKGLVDAVLENTCDAIRRDPSICRLAPGVPPDDHRRSEQLVGHNVADTVPHAPRPGATGVEESCAAFGVGCGVRLQWCDEFHTRVLPTTRKCEYFNVLNSILLNSTVLVY